jgi:hypothetical protein
MSVENRIDTIKKSVKTETYEGVPHVLGVPTTEPKVNTTFQLEELPNKDQYFDKPKAKVYLNGQILCDSKVEELSDMPGIIEVCEESWDTLEMFAKDKVPIIDAGTFSELKRLLYDTKTEEEKNSGISVKIVKYFGKYNLNGEGRKQCEIWREGETGLCLRLQENPYNHKKIPFVKLVYKKKTGSAFGTSAAEIIYTRQIELNDTHKQIMDNKTALMYQMLLVDKSAGVKKSDLRWRPNGIVYYSGGPNMKPDRFPVANFVSTGVGVLERLMNEAQNEANASPSIQGEKLGSNTTAYEVNVALTQSQMDIRALMERLGRDFIVPSLRFFYKLTLQYMDKSMQGMVLESNKPLNVSRLDIVADIDFVVNDVMSMQKDLFARKEALDIYNLFAQDEYIDPIWSRKWFFMHRGLEAEIPRAIRSPKPPNPLTPGTNEQDLGTGIPGALNPQLLQSGPLNRMGG